MATYTTTIRAIVESNSPATLPITQRIEHSLPLIFDFDFPIFDESHRTELERKIILHYFNREIGLETYALWKLYLNERLNLEMPYYNELYSTVNNKFDYLINADTIRQTENNQSVTGTKTEQSNGTSGNVRDITGNDTRKVTNSGTDTNTTQYGKTEHTDLTESVETHATDTQENNSTGTTIGSDFPQATFNNSTDYASQSTQTETTGGSGGTTTANQSSSSNSNVMSGGSDTATTQHGHIVDEVNNNSGKITDSGSTTDNTTGSTAQDTHAQGSDRLYGTQGSKTALMVEYRNAIINIDKMIVNMLSDLFMGVY